MKHDIALLASGLQIRQPLPVHKIFGASYGSSGSCRRQVARRRCRVMSFRTENAVHPAVFMRRKAHIINIGSRNHIFGHRNRIIPKTEIVNAIRTLGHRKKRFTVGTFHTYYQQVLAVPFNCSGIQCSVHTDTLHQIRVGFRIQIITPENRSMGSRQYRILITGENTVTVFQRHILAGNQFIVIIKQSIQLLFKCNHINRQIKCRYSLIYIHLTSSR